MTSLAVRTRVGRVDDVPPYEGRVVRIGDSVIAVFRTDAGFYALDNACSHLGGPLADGIVADATVACPLHERRFGLADGRPLGHDCPPVAAYPVEVRDGDLYLALPPPNGNGGDPGAATAGADQRAGTGAASRGCQGLARRSRARLVAAERARGEDAEDDAYADLARRP